MTADAAWNTLGLIYYEDVPIDMPVTLGSYTVTKDEIITFASEFDPQPMHIDEEAAKATLVGGLCASGWHTCAIFMRMIYDGWLSNATSLGAPGIDEVRWRRPVRPGDILALRGVCTAKRLMKSRPGVGICAMSYEMTTSGNAVVMTLQNPQMLGTRATTGVMETAR